jgi:hypothetical protein
MAGALLLVALLDLVDRVLLTVLPLGFSGMYNPRRPPGADVRKTLSAPRSLSFFRLSGKTLKVLPSFRRILQEMD